MPSLNVDMVFVIDASESMQPCFEALRTHLDKIIQPMQGYVSKVRFGLVAQSAGSARGQVIYDHQFLCGSGMDALKKLYQKGPNDPDPRNEFFTDDPKKFAAALAALKPQGNEEMLVALDVAADFPFGPLSTTKRVIALFSDEAFEGGISKDALNAKIPALSKKFMDRHIQLFVAIPDSPAIQELAMVDRSEVELVDGGNGLKGVDFKQLLGQMGKSISGSSMQAVGEPTYQRAIFGQDSWGEDFIGTMEKREKIGQAGESFGIRLNPGRVGALIKRDGPMSVFAPVLAAQIKKKYPDSIIAYSFNQRYGDGYTPDSTVHFGGEYSFDDALFTIMAPYDPSTSEELIAWGEKKFNGIFGVGKGQYFEYRINHGIHFMDGNFASLVKLAHLGCNVLYWICDLDAACNKSTVDFLADLLLPAKVKLYVRSRLNGPDAYPGLAELCRKSGGGIKCGPFDSNDLA